MALLHLSLGCGDRFIITWLCPSGNIIYREILTKGLWGVWCPHFLQDNLLTTVHLQVLNCSKRSEWTWMCGVNLKHRIDWSTWLSIQQRLPIWHHKNVWRHFNDSEKVNLSTKILCESTEDRRQHLISFPFAFLFLWCINQENSQGPIIWYG